MNKKLTFGLIPKLQIRLNISTRLIWIIFSLGVLLIFFMQQPEETFRGYLLILTHPSVLATDYLRIAGFYPTLLNVWITTFVSIWFFDRQKMPLSGSIIAGIFTITGFSFFGKNLLNMIPIWVGYYLYTLVNQVKIKDSLGTFFFSSGIAPIFSFILFGTTMPLWLSIPIGFTAGIMTGFLVPIVASLTAKFHQGYNLYNTGFAIGFIAMLHGAFLRALNISLVVDNTASFAFHEELMFLTILFSFLCLIIGMLYDPFTNRKIFILSNKAVDQPTDFVKAYGVGQTLINLGIMGLFSLAVIVVLGLRISGPMMAAIYTVIGFSAFGKTIRTSIPLMLGAYFATLITKYNIYDLGPSIALFFVTALSPITGKFGVGIAFIAGFFHIMLTEYALYLQGGFALYNNGFTAGFVAAIIALVGQQTQLIIAKIKPKITPKSV
jgi:hypothetical protein